MSKKKSSSKGAKKGKAAAGFSMMKNQGMTKVGNTFKKGGMCRGKKM